MEVAVADDRVKGREILREALEKPEEVHPSVDVHALGGAEALVSANKVARDSLTLGNQTPEDSLCVVESRHGVRPGCAEHDPPRPRPPEALGCRRHARSEWSTARSGAPPRRRGPTPHR